MTGPQIERILARCAPSGTALLDWLRRRVSDSMLREIANSDYGFDYDEHLAALKSIRDGNPIPVPLRWFPREALELTRWREPDVKYENCRLKRSTGRRGHLIRAFCCAVLLVAAAEPETADYTGSENATLAGLIESVLVLGREAAEGALQLVARRIPGIPPYSEEAAFFALGALMLRAALFEPGTDAADLITMADWVIAEEQRIRTDEAMIAVSDRWMFGLTLFDSRFDTWRAVSRRILLAPGRFPQPAAGALRGIVERLASAGAAPQSQ